MILLDLKFLILLCRFHRIWFEIYLKILNFSFQICGKKSSITIFLMNEYFFTLKYFFLSKLAHKYEKRGDIFILKY